MLYRFKNITTFIFDVDGVLTDSTIYVFNSGEQVRQMNIKDGFALQLAIKKGYTVVVISGGNSAAVIQRLNKLGISQVLMNIENKKKWVDDFVAESHKSTEEILFMGDDIPDLELMKSIPLSCAPADAAVEIRQVAKYISFYNGGRGCVRDVIEKVLKVRGDWELDTNIPCR